MTRGTDAIGPNDAACFQGKCCGEDERRVFQHKAHTSAGFTDTYNVTNLVYAERYGSVTRAISREKELKKWRREKKVALIEAVNPKWRDLSYGWYDRYRPDGKTS